MEQLDFIISGGETKRFHTWPMLREQTVGHHSFGVALLYSMMAAQDGELATGGLTVPGLMAALTHDLAEHKMGDLPAPAKRAMPAMFEGQTFRESWGIMEAELLGAQDLEWESMLQPHEQRWLKLADNMEGALRCIRERQMGNQLMTIPFGNFRSYIRGLSDFNRMDFIASKRVPNCEQQIINYIDDMWEQADGNR